MVRQTKGYTDERSGRWNGEETDKKGNHWIGELTDRWTDRHTNGQTGSRRSNG